MDGHQARYAEVSIIYEGKDISRDIAPYLISFTYTDNASDTESLPCGLFEVDQIECSGPPNQVTIKAVSTLVSKPMRQEKHTKAWENVTLSAIAGDFANKSGLGLFWDSSEDPQFERRDQVEVSDLEFLSGLCRDYDTIGGKLKELEAQRQEFEDTLKELELKNKASLISKEQVKEIIIRSGEFIRAHNISECRNFIKSYIEKVIVYDEKVEVIFKVNVFDKETGEVAPMKSEETVKNLRLEYQDVEKGHSSAGIVPKNGRNFESEVA